MRSRCLAPAAALALAALALTTDARAEDWPVFRHDARRTGAAAATVPIDRPAVRFQTYLGGALSARDFVDLDTDGDGQVEIVYVSGGRVVAKRGDNLAVWESEILPVDELVGVVDFDEDGREELLLIRNRPAALRIVSGRDGSSASAGVSR